MCLKLDDGEPQRGTYPISIRALVAKVGDLSDKKNADTAALREALQAAPRDLGCQKPSTKTGVKENSEDSLSRVDRTAAQEASENPSPPLSGGGE